MAVAPGGAAVDIPVVTSVDATAFTVPSDAPEADGTLAGAHGHGAAADHGIRRGPGGGRPHAVAADV
jgi:hypothetical protein